MVEQPDPQKSREHDACFNLRRCIMRKLIKRALTKICGVPHAAFLYGPN